MGGDSRLKGECSVGGLAGLSDSVGWLSTRTGADWSLGRWEKLGVMRGEVEDSVKDMWEMGAV